MNRVVIRTLWVMFLLSASFAQLDKAVEFHGIHIGDSTADALKRLRELQVLVPNGSDKEARFIDVGDGVELTNVVMTKEGAITLRSKNGELISIHVILGRDRFSTHVSAFTAKHGKPRERIAHYENEGTTSSGRVVRWASAEQFIEGEENCGTMLHSVNSCFELGIDRE